MRGITIILYDRVEVGKDKFNIPIYEEVPIPVENVLVSPASPEDLPQNLNLDGRKIVYTLAIPKKDQNEWEDRTVEFFGQKWHTFGIPSESIEHLTPLSWNKKVMVERFG